MLFITNRTPVQSTRSRVNRPIRFNLQETCASQHLFFCERKAENEYIEIGSKEFFSRIKTLPDDTQVLFYIHGFNNTGEENIFPNTKRIQGLFDRTGKKNLVYVVPLIWPCDDDSVAAIADDYWDDQDAADASGKAFSRLLGKFADWRLQKEQVSSPCCRRMNILAHSMGNRVLQNALAKWAKDHNSGHMPLLFRNIFMVAADVKNNTLEKGKRGRFIPDAARNVIVYYAKDDLALTASKIANIKNKMLSRRMGMTGPGHMDRLPGNVYTVDCDNFNNSCDPPVGHSYYMKCPQGKVSPVLAHMVKAVETGRVSPDMQQTELSAP